MYSNQQIIHMLIQCFEDERYNNVTLNNLYLMSINDLNALVAISKAIFDCQVTNKKSTKSACIENISEIINNTELKQAFCNLHKNNRQRTKDIYERLRKKLNIKTVNNNDFEQINTSMIERQNLQLFPNDLTNLRPKNNQFKLLLYVGLYDITKQKHFIQQIDIQPQKDICYVAIFHQLKMFNMDDPEKKKCRKEPLVSKGLEREIMYVNGIQTEVPVNGEYNIIKLSQLNEVCCTYQFDVECVEYEQDTHSHKQFCSIYLAKQMQLTEQFYSIFERQLYLPLAMYKFVQKQSLQQLIKKFNKHNIIVQQVEKVNDDELDEIENITLVPICQLSKSQIQFPVIGKECTHWHTCMDLNSYLLENENRCYLCQKTTYYDDLIVHVLFYYIYEQKIRKLTINNVGDIVEKKAKQEDEATDELSGWS